MCTVVLDRQMHDVGKAKSQRKMLRELVQAGAQVFTAQRPNASNRHPGPCHVKAIILDGKAAYAGSANCTEASDKNLETVVRFSGPVVSDVVQALRSLFYYCERV